jgi:hypothetical protein
VADSTANSSTPLSVLNLTIAGAYPVPSHGIKGEAVASALLVDVRKGSPYGTVTATGRETGFVPSIGSDDRTRTIGGDAVVAAVANLAPEVATMMSRLSAELAERKTAAPEAKPVSVPAPKLHDARS